MNGLLSYSGISTKIRAMESHFITETDFEELASLETVPAAVEHLRNNPSYTDVFKDLDTCDMHRGNIEGLLTLSLYNDFAKLYRFSNMKQRKFLDLYFMHYEISILKKCLRSVLEHYTIDLDLSIFSDFFMKHSKIDPANLAASTSISELISNLEGSIFYDLLNKINNSDNPTLFDYEMQMDLFYFKTIWQIKNKYLKGAEKNVLAQCFGTKLDMLNIQWIYRSKEYYNLKPEEISSLIIPINYKLTKHDLNEMIHAETIHDFFNRLSQTKYGNNYFNAEITAQDLEFIYSEVIDHIYQITSQNAPYSIAVLNSYLYFKECEIEKVITAIECIRYGLKPETTMSYIYHKKGALKS